jgi:hypothetical protein
MQKHLMASPRIRSWRFYLRRVRARRFNHWCFLFLFLLLVGCRNNPPATQPQRNDVPAVQNLERDYSALVAQFNADSAKVRMLMMLSPT